MGAGCNATILFTLLVRTLTKRIVCLIIEYGLAGSNTLVTNHRPEYNRAFASFQKNCGWSEHGFPERSDHPPGRRSGVRPLSFQHVQSESKTLKWMSARADMTDGGEHAFAEDSCRGRDIILMHRYRGMCGNDCQQFASHHSVHGLYFAREKIGHPDKTAWMGGRAPRRRLLGGAGVTRGVRRGAVWESGCFGMCWCGFLQVWLPDIDSNPVTTLQAVETGPLRFRHRKGRFPLRR